MMIVLSPWIYLVVGVLGVGYGLEWASRPEAEASWVGALIAPASLTLFFLGLLGVLIPGFLGT